MRACVSACAGVHNVRSHERIMSIQMANIQKLICFAFVRWLRWLGIRVVRLAIIFHALEFVLRLRTETTCS